MGYDEDLQCKISATTRHMFNRFYTVDWCTLSPEIMWKKIPTIGAMYNARIINPKWVPLCILVGHLPAVVLFGGFCPCSQLYAFSGWLFHFSIYGSLFCPLCWVSAFLYIPNLLSWMIEHGPWDQILKWKANTNVHHPIAPTWKASGNCVFILIQKTMERKYWLFLGLSVFLVDSFGLSLASLLYAILSWSDESDHIYWVGCLWVDWSLPRGPCFSQSGRYSYWASYSGGFWH